MAKPALRSVGGSTAMASASEGAELETAADPASGGIKFRLPAICQIRAGKFEIRTLDEARNLAAMLSLACADSGQVGVSFLESMINAIEHGNLGFEEKSELLAQDTCREEIDRRLVTADRKSAGVRLLQPMRHSCGAGGCQVEE